MCENCEADGPKGIPCVTYDEDHARSCLMYGPYLDDRLAVPAECSCGE